MNYTREDIWHDVALDRDGRTCSICSRTWSEHRADTALSECRWCGEPYCGEGADCEARSEIHGRACSICAAAEARVYARLPWDAELEEDDVLAEVRAGAGR